MSPVVPYSYTIYSCPNCRRFLDCRIMGICCLLGSSLYVCPRCGTHIDSGRGEWVDLGLPVRLWFGTISLIYAGVIGLLGGVTTLLLVHVWQGRDLSSHFRLRDEPGFIVGAICWAVLVGVVQILRILSSLRRTVNDEVVPVPARFWGLHSNWQLKMGIIVWVPALLAGGVALFHWLLW